MTEEYAVKENMNKCPSPPVTQRRFSTEREPKRCTESCEKRDPWGAVAPFSMEAGKSHNSQTWKQSLMSNFQSKAKRWPNWWLWVWFMESKTRHNSCFIRIYKRKHNFNIQRVYVHPRKNSSWLWYCYLWAISWLDGVCTH